MPSLPPKCSYTTGLETRARAAISSTLVPSKPFSAKRVRETASNCSRRSLPVMRTLFALLLFRVTPPSCLPPAFTGNTSDPGGHFVYQLGGWHNRKSVCADQLDHP